MSVSPNNIKLLHCLDMECLKGPVLKDWTPACEAAGSGRWEDL